MVGCTPKEFVLKAPPARPTAKEVPNAKRVIIRDVTRIRVSNDGSTYTKDVHVQVKVLSAGVFRVSALAWYGANERITNFHARLLRPGGKWTSWARFYTDAVPTGRQKYIEDSRYKGTRISNVVPGSLFEYRYTKVSQTFNMRYAHLQSTRYPSRNVAVYVSIPSKLALRSMIIDNPAVPRTKVKYTRNTDPNDSSRVLHVWKVDRAPKFKGEVSMPSWFTSIAHVKMQLASYKFGKTWGQGDSWKNMSRSFAKIYGKRNTTTPYVRDFTLKLIKGTSSKEDKIRKIYDFVRKDIRYVFVGVGLGGNDPQSAEFTLRNRYGDCKAKSVLLVSMLRAINVKAHSVLVRTWKMGRGKKNFPYLTFNHAMNYLPSFKGGLFVDATTNDNRLELLRWDDQGASALVIDENKGFFTTIPAFEAKKNLRHDRFELRVKANQHMLEGRIVRRLGGLFRVRMDGQIEKGEFKEEKARKAMAMKIVQAALLPFKLHMEKKAKPSIQSVSITGGNKPQVTVEISFTAKLKKGRLKRMWMPLQLFVKGGPGAYYVKARKLHALSKSRKATYLTELVLKGWTVLEKPENLSLSSPHLSYALRAQKGERTLNLRREVVYKSHLVPVEEHATFRKQGLQIRERDRSIIVLKEGALDKDKDGVPDDQDKCKLIPGLKKFDGCPDTDGDGIGDHEDRCPNLKGVPHPEDLSKNGCPKVVLVKVTKDEVKILQKIQFGLGSARIKRKSYNILDQVVAVLKLKSKARVRIEGHTDNQGNKRYNKKLSQRRANSVLRYLVKRGKLDKERFEAVGYGPDQPLVKNDSAKNRATNRRVQFKIIK